MDFNKIKKDCMKEEYIKQITSWKYEDEYYVYNLPTYKECIDKKYSITDINKKDNYVVYLIDDEVIFYLNMKPLNDNKIFIGIGLKPEYCGKGLSNYFLEDSLKVINEKYPDKLLYLQVRSWNKRAIKLYKKHGFNINNTITINNVEYIEMTK